MKSIEQVVVLSKEDCKKLVDYFESDYCRKYIRQSQYGNSGINGIVSSDFIPSNIFEKLKVFNVLPFEFTFGTRISNSLILHKYSEGDSFPPHRDDDVSNYGSIDKSRMYRHKTLVFQLSDEFDYDGGDFIVDGKKMNKSIGNCICFDSKLLHEVEPVKSGIRYSMSLWIKKENLSTPLVLI